MKTILYSVIIVFLPFYNLFSQRTDTTVMTDNKIEFHIGLEFLSGITFMSDHHLNRKVYYINPVDTSLVPMSNRFISVIGADFLFTLRKMLFINILISLESDFMKTSEESAEIVGVDQERILWCMSNEIGLMFPLLSKHINKNPKINLLILKPLISVGHSFGFVDFSGSSGDNIHIYPSDIEIIDLDPSMPGKEGWFWFDDCFYIRPGFIIGSAKFFFVIGYNIYLFPKKRDLKGRFHMQFMVNMW